MTEALSVGKHGTDLQNDPLLNKGTFFAAAQALAAASGSGSRLFPELHELRAISRIVATAVAGCLSDLSDDEIDRRLDALIWEPEYRPYRPSTTG